MVELIKIHERNNQQLVNARELYNFLGSKQEFSNWIKNRIDKYGFVLNQDFTIDKFINRKNWQIEYALTLDMAKELCMVENNERGRQARRYFIEIEKKYKSFENLSKKQLAEKMMESLKMVIESEEKVERLAIENQIKDEIISDMKPKVDLMSNLMGLNKDVEMRIAVKILKLPGRNKVFDMLRDRGILCADNTPRQTYIEKGYFKMNRKYIEKIDRWVDVTVVTSKGIFFLADLFKVVPPSNYDFTLFEEN